MGRAERSADAKKSVAPARWLCDRLRKACIAARPGSRHGDRARPLPVPVHPAAAPAAEHRDGESPDSMLALVSGGFRARCSATSRNPMGFPLELAIRYMRSKRRGFVSVGTAFAVIGVALGVCALTTVIAVTGGFRKEFRDKVLGVNAHVLILKYSSDFREYRDLIKKVKDVPGVTGIAPFVINPMMVTHGDRTATGVLLKGVDPSRVDQVLDLPRHIVEGSLKGLRLSGAEPPERRRTAFSTGRKKKKQEKAPTETENDSTEADIGPAKKLE